MPTIQLSDGCSLFYRLDGEEGRPVLMFSNPHGFTHELWNPQIEAMTSRFRVLRYDYRGHGDSEVWNGPYSLARAALDAAELIEGVGLRSVAFCGLSIGGMVGVWLAANRPDLLTATVLANTSLHLDPADHLKRRLALIDQGGMAPVVDDIIQRSLSGDFRRENPDIAARLEKMVAAIPPAGYIAGGQAVLEMDLRACPQNIDLPVLIIAGSADTSTPPFMGEEIADRIPGARYALLDSAHLSNVERATEFNRLMLDFLP